MDRRQSSTPAATRVDNPGADGPALRVALGCAAHLLTRKQYRPVIAITRCVVALEANQFGYHTCSTGSCEVKHKIDRVADLMANRLVRQLDSALDDTRGKARERLLR